MNATTMVRQSSKPCAAVSDSWFPRGPANTGVYPIAKSEHTRTKVSKGIMLPPPCEMDEESRGLLNPKIEPLAEVLQGLPNASNFLPTVIPPSRFRVPGVVLHSVEDESPEKKEDDTSDS